MYTFHHHSPGSKATRFQQHDPNELEKLIKEWLAVCQQSLQDLEQKLKEQNSDSANVGIVELLKHLNIEPELVGYSVEDETFTS